MSFLQNYFKSLYVNIAKIDLKLKHSKQKLNQIVNEIISYLKKLKTQLFEFLIKYQEYFNFFHALHLYLRKTMLKNRFEVLLKLKLKKTDLMIRTYRNFFRKRENFRKFNSNKVEKKFLYKFFNVKNDDDDVESAIDRNEYKNKNKDREYRENRRRKNEISREKIKEFEKNNVIDFSKINCFKYRQKSIMFAIASFSHLLINRKIK